jgi:protein-tyrosine kinase
MSRYYKQIRKENLMVTEENKTNGAQLDEVLGTVQEEERALNEGAFSRFSDCKKITLTPQKTYPVLVGAEHLEPAAADCYRVLRTRLVRQMSLKGLRSVVVSSATPGEGKTLTTLNLAITCAKLHGQKVLLVDADLRTRGLSRLLGISDSPGLFEVLQGEVPVESAVLVTNIPNLCFISAGQGSERFPEAFAGDRWKALMGCLTESFKTILVDTPPIVPLADSELIAAGCDGILLVVRALKTNREVLRKAVKQVDSKKVLGVVFNDAKALDGYCYYGTGYGNQQAKS